MTGRFLRHAARFALILAATTAAFGPCTEDMVDEFREEASDDIAAGLKTIANGVIDGFFSALDPGTDQLSSGSIGTTLARARTRLAAAYDELDSEGSGEDVAH